MKKIVFCLLIIIGLFIITGCDKNNTIEGKWVATPKNQKVYKTDDNETVGGKEDYNLECDGKGHYDLTMKDEDLANASYEVSNNKVTFYDEGRQPLAICKIKGNELDCREKSHYATKYVKVKD